LNISLTLQSAITPFKVIQGHWFWYQSKDHTLVKFALSTGGSSL